MSKGDRPGQNWLSSSAARQISSFHPFALPLVICQMIGSSRRG
jgi:hypothetical protein